MEGTNPGRAATRRRSQWVAVHVCGTHSFTQHEGNAPFTDKWSKCWFLLLL